MPHSRQVSIVGSLGLLLFLSICVNAYLAWPYRSSARATHIPLPLGYQAFDFPRNFGSQPLIGAIVTIGAKRGFTYAYHLSKCGIDSGVLTPQEGVIALPTISRSYSMDAGASAEVGSNAGANIKAQAGDQFTVSLLKPKELFIITGDVLTNALERGAELKRLCGSFLDSKNSFWIPTAIVSDEFEIAYSSTGKAAGSLDVNTPEKIKSFASSKLGIKGDGEYTDKGTIKYKGERLYIGFREAYPIELLTGRISTFGGNEDATSLPLGDFIYSSDG